MLQATTVSRVDDFWSSTLGVVAGDLHAPDVRVHPHPPSRASWRGIYALGFEGVAVFAPTDLLEQVTVGVKDRDAESLLAAETWRVLLGDAVRSAWGPVLHYYRDRRDGLDEIAAGRRINPRDAEALAALRSAVAPTDWLLAGFTAQPAVMFGVFEGEALVAAANLTAGPDAATDVGLVVHPDARGKGYGLQLAACAARQAIVMHGVARFRALTSSPATMALAERLGFEPYGRNVAAYLKDHAEVGTF